MFNFKALAATALIAATSVIAPVAAEAGTRCERAGAYNICQTDNGHYGTDYIGVFRGGQNVAFMSVICTGGGGNRWEGERNASYISYNDMQTLANQWCRNY
jgi:hypothetical protein